MVEERRTVEEIIEEFYRERVVDLGHERINYTPSNDLRRKRLMEQVLYYGLQRGWIEEDEKVSNGPTDLQSYKITLVARDYFTRA